MITFNGCFQKMPVYRNPYLQFSIFFTLLFFISLSSLKAQVTFTSNTLNGNWNVPGNWTISGGADSDADNIPDANDDVIILAGANITISDTRGALSVAINSGGAVNTLATLTFTSAGNLTVIGAVIMGASGTTRGNINMTSGGILRVGGAFTKPSTSSTLTPGVGTIDYNGTGVQTILAINYYNLIVSGARTSNNVVFSNAGQLGIISSFNPAATFTSGSYIITGTLFNFVGGNQNIPGFTYNVLVASGGGTKTMTGPVVVNSTFNITAVKFSIGSNTLTVNASLARTSGVLVGSSTSNLTIGGNGPIGTLYFDQTATPSTNGISNLVINRVAGESIFLGNTLNVFNTATFTRGVLDVNGNIFRLGGTVTRTNGTVTVPSGFVTFNGTSSQNIPTGLFTSNAAANITIANPAGVTFNGSVAVSGNFQINANSLFTPAAAVIISGTGTLLGGNSSTAVAQVTRATGTSDFLGQYTIANKNLTNLNVEFIGATAQGAAANTFGGLKISNNNGVTMSGDVTVNDVFNLNAGNFSLATNTLTLNGTATRTSGFLTGSSTSNLSIGGTGPLSTLFFNQTTPGTSNSLSTFTINRTSSGTVTLGNDLTCGTSLVLTDGTLQIAANTLTLNGTVSRTNGALTGSASSNLTIGGTGALGTLYFDQTNPGASNLLANFIVNRTSSGVVTLGSNLICGTSLALTDGNLQIGGNTFTINGAYSRTNGFFTGSITSNLVIGGSGAFGSLFFNQAILGTTNLLATFTLNRPGGIVTMGNTLNIFGSAVFTTGVLDVNGNILRLSGTVSTGGGTITNANSNGIITFTGGIARIIPADVFTSNASTNITITNTSGVTFNGSVAVSGNFQVNANSIFIPAASAIISGTGTLLGGSNSTAVARVTRATGTADFTGQYTITNKNLTNLNIEFIGASAQGVAATTFGGLKISNSNGVTLGGNVIVNAGLNLNTGNLSINGNSLTLNGAVTRTSGNLAGGNTSSLIIGGTAGSLFFDNSGTNNYLKNFTINTAASATLGNTLNIAASDGSGTEGVLTVTGTGILTSGGLLTIKSNASGTARIAPGNTAGGYISGAVGVERFIPQNSSRAWRLLASNTSGQTINAAWQEGVIGSLLNPNPGFGTIITANQNLFGNSLAAAQASGFDTLSQGTSLYKYNPATDNLDPVPNTNATNIGSEQGFFLFVRGDRSPGQFGTGAPTTTTVLRSRGTLFLGDQSAVSTGASGWALVRNPYPSRIDMRNIVRGGGLIDAYQVWDSKLGGSFGVGGYQTFTKSGSDYIVSPGGGSYGANGSISNFIESGAAFYIQSSGGGSAQVTEACKTSGSSINSYRPAGTTGTEQRIAFNLSSVNGGVSDVVDGGLVFFNGLSNTIDINDVRKSPNINENFGLIRNNTSLVVERRQTLAAGGVDTIFFDMNHLKNITYKLDIQPENIDPSITTAVLEDMYTNTKTPLNLGSLNTYTFTATSAAASKAANRLRVIFGQGVVLPVSFVNMKATQVGKNIEVDWKVANQLNLSHYEVEKSGNGKDFSKTGTVAATGTESYSWIDESVQKGNNFYRIRSVDMDGKFKYTDIVKVFIGDNNEIITIISNPVRNGILELKFNNKAQAFYGVNLLSMSGQLIYKAQVRNDGNGTIEKLTLPTNIANGIYKLQLIGSSNETVVHTLTINK